MQKETEKTDVDNQTLDDILQACGMKDEQYHKALAVLMGSTVIMKRGTADMWTNNYNLDILQTRHENTDIQYITDVYACIVDMCVYMCTCA